MARNNNNTNSRNRSSRRFLERLRRNMRSIDESSNEAEESENIIEDTDPIQMPSNLSSLVERYLRDNSQNGTWPSSMDNLLTFNSPRSQMRQVNRQAVIIGIDEPSSIVSASNSASRRVTKNHHTDWHCRTTGPVHNESLKALKNIYASDFLMKVQFPTALDENKMSASLELMDKYTVKYKEQNQSNEAGLIKSNFLIPFHCGVYYFEVKIINKGQQGVVSIGLTDSQVTLKSLPGWDINSYGYHGDDGNIFIGNGKGTSYGPGYSTDDVVGCCLNFIEKKCFFTKNGNNIGVAFTDILNNLFVTIGMRHDRTNMTVNFGQDDFLFNFEEYVYNVKLNHMMDIQKSTLDDHILNIEMQKLVLSYLLFNGYIESAQLFAQKTGQIFEIDDFKKIKSIVDLIKNGNSGLAIIQIHQNYPKLFKKQPSILFELRIQQYVEKILLNDNEIVHPKDFLYDICMMENSDGKSLSAQNQTQPSSISKTSEKSYQTEIEMSNSERVLTDLNENLGQIPIDECSHVTSMNIVSDNELINESKPQVQNDINQSSIEIQSPVSSMNHKLLVFPNIELINYYFNPAGIDNQLAQMSQLDNIFETQDLNNLKNLLIFGHLLYQAGAYLFSEGLITSTLYDHMMKVFGLIVVKDIKNSPLDHLISDNNRIDLSKTINSTILEYLDKAPYSNIDILQSQINNCYRKIVDKRVKFAGFLDISQICN